MSLLVVYFSRERISFLVQSGERVGLARRVRVASDGVCWLNIIVDDEVCVMWRSERKGKGERKEKRKKERTKRSRVQVSYPGSLSSHTKLSLRFASLARTAL